MDSRWRTSWRRDRQYVVLATGATVGTFAAEDKLPGQSHEPSTLAARNPAARPTEDSEATGTPRSIKGVATHKLGHPEATEASTP